MRTANRKRVLEAHQFAKHFCTADYRDAAVAGLDKFRIVVRHGRRIHDEVRILHVLGIVFRRNLYTESLEIIDNRAFAHIGTGHVKTVLVQHLGNAGHSRTADTDEVEATYTFTIINLH